MKSSHRPLPKTMLRDKIYLGERKEMDSIYIKIQWFLVN
jgi:hypothetical protein